MNRTFSEILNDGGHLEILLQDLNNGSKTSALLMVNELNKRLINSPSSIPKSVREWLADCLTDIACNNISGKKALGLSGKTKLHDPEHIIHLTVDQVYQYIINTGLPLHKSATSPSAFIDAATKFNISASSAEKYYYFALKNYTDVDEDFLRNIIGLTDEEIENDKIMNHYPIRNGI
jgi:hypothetical protein